MNYKIVQTTLDEHPEGGGIKRDYQYFPESLLETIRKRMESDNKLERMRGQYRYDIVPYSGRIPQSFREQRRNQAVGSVVVLYDTAAPDNVFDPEGGRYVTYCETHGLLVNHETFKLAQAFLSVPWQWCEECATLYDAGERVPKG